MKNIAAALVKAQRAFGPALKSSTNPHFKSKYADLSACVEAVIDGLNANGIALVQRTSEDQTGVTVTTVFVHESGEMLDSGPLHVPAAKNDPQGYGSALTYARRYSLMAACGIAPEDDDGNAARKPATKVLSATDPNTGDVSWLKDEPSDPLSIFPQQAKAQIMKSAQAAIQSFREGNEWGAYEELTSCVSKIGKGDAANENQVKTALASIYSSTPNMKAAMRTLSERENHNRPAK